MNKKRIGLVLVVLFVIAMFVMMRNEHTYVVKENERLTDSLFLVLKKQDTLYLEIGKLQDSLLKAKTDTLIKIKEVYEGKANDIINLPIDGQVELLTKYLSKDTVNWK